ncbi:MAG TPA: HAD family phosphatase [Candidatus Dormibacteraeota bacterium]|nr:HAD family phosphatase [Candidatus Dormibacteraeota bacterium]
MPAIDIRAIIFDIGRVLVRIDVSRAMDGLGSAASLSPEEVWTAIEKDPRWPDWQEGRISPHDWHLHISKRFGGGVTFEKFSELWNRVLDPKPIQDNVFLEKLSECYRLALLSNTDPIHVAWLEANFDFFRLFPNRIYSCVVGASKPSPLIYREALRTCKVTATQALYIDDIPAYVEAAQRLGMHGIVFRSSEQLLTDLRRLRIVED